MVAGAGYVSARGFSAGGSSRENMNDRQGGMRLSGRHAAVGPGQWPFPAQVGCPVPDSHIAMAVIVAASLPLLRVRDADHAEIETGQGDLARDVVGDHQPQGVTLLGDVLGRRTRKVKK